MAKQEINFSIQVKKILAMIPYDSPYKRDYYKFKLVINDSPVDRVGSTVQVFSDSGEHLCNAKIKKVKSLK